MSQFHRSEAVARPLLRLKIFLRVIAIEAVCISFGIGLGALVGGKKEMIILGIAVFAFTVLIGLIAEQAILRNFSATFEPFPNLKKTVARKCVQLKVRLPRVLVYLDPSPNALVLKGLRRRGTLLLSQGLIATLTEAELSEVLTASLNRLSRPGLRLQTICSFCAQFALKFAPEKWINVLLRDETLKKEDGKLTPFSAVAFLGAFFAAKKFIKWGNTGDFVLDAPTEPWFSAMHKITRSLKFAKPSGSPAIAKHYLANPWSDIVLLR